MGEIPPVYTLEVDYSAQKLIAVLRNGTLFSRDLIDATVIDERSNWTTITSSMAPGASVSSGGGNGAGFKAVLKSQFFNNRLFWISKSCGDSHPWDTCLYSEEFSKKNIYLSRWVQKSIYSGGHIRKQE